jgi:peptidoglycan/xylan/chitin deacetylase (PgdA/CDA1 family)
MLSRPAQEAQGFVRSLRDQALRLLDGAGVVGASLRLRSILSLPWLTVLCYHRTAEPIVAGELDDAVVDATPAQFDAQLRRLGQHFRFVSLDEVVDATRGGPLPPNPLLLSFDDGYRNCLETSLPILERHGVPAAFFIPTMHVGERRMFWWDHIAWVLRRTTRELLELDHPRPLRLVLSGGTDEAHRTLTTLVKRTKGLDIERFLDGLETAAGVALGRDEERRVADRDLLDWDGVRALERAGMGIGSHTHSHRVLQTLHEPELELELAGSRRELERQLGRPVRSIAYPVGYPIARDERIRRAVRDAGYDVGFSCRAGVHPTRVGDPLDVPRLLMEKDHDAQAFSALTALPSLAPRTTIDAGWSPA